MEGEIRAFILVWLSAVVSLWYCHKIGKIVPKGIARLFAVLPIVFFFLYLPLNLFSIYLGGPTSFFLSWLATFKLLLFAFGQGPLSSPADSPPLSLPLFIAIACLPIKIQQNDCKNGSSPLSQSPQSGKKSPLNYALKMLIVSTFPPIYDRKDQIHPKLLMTVYCVYLYVCLEFGLVCVAALARTCVGFELEPQFNEPYLGTSLQDFWGRRWNLMVTSILRPTVYNPVRSISTRWIGKKWAPLPAVLASFFVSGIMHELVFYHIGRHRPTWELTCFFLLHGSSVAVEIALKRLLNGKWQLPRVVSGPLTVAFVVVTALWLFMPQVLLCEVDVKGRRETTAFINFVKDVVAHLRYMSFGSKLSG